MTTTAARRERQRIQLIDAAEKAIAERGLAGLKARELAQEIGCALGAIYNLVADMDELVLRVGSRTLARLDMALSAAEGEDEDAPASADAAAHRLVAVALAYCAFARDNLQLWRVLFEHRMAEGAVVPDWAVSEQMTLFRHILEPLSVLVPDRAEPERMLMSRTLFSAVHGVVAIGLEEKLIAVPRRDLDRQIEGLVRLVCRGLAAPP